MMTLIARYFHRRFYYGYMYSIENREHHALIIGLVLLQNALLFSGLLMTGDIWGPLYCVNCTLNLSTTPNAFRTISIFGTEFESSDDKDKGLDDDKNNDSGERVYDFGPKAKEKCDGKGSDTRKRGHKGRKRRKSTTVMTTMLSTIISTLEEGSSSFENSFSDGSSITLDQDMYRKIYENTGNEKHKPPVITTTESVIVFAPKVEEDFFAEKLMEKPPGPSEEETAITQYMMLKEGLKLKVEDTPSYIVKDNEHNEENIRLPLMGKNPNSIPVVRKHPIA